MIQASTPGSFERRPMRVLLHHRTQGRGVEGVHIIGITRGLQQLGCEVTIVSPPGVEVDEVGYETQGTGTGSLWKTLSERLPEFLFECMEIVYNVPALVRLSVHLRAGRCCVLYERHALLNVAGLLAAHWAGIPIVLEVNYTSQSPLYRKRSRLLSALTRILEEFVIRRADAIAAVSSVIRDELIQRGVEPGRIEVVPNAADPALFHPEVSGSAVRERHGLVGRRVVGFCGGFYPWHGVEMILDAFPAIRKRAPDAAVLLMGDGPLREKLETRVQESGFEDCFRFAGWVSHGELPKHIAAFDVAVMPHSNAYGSPMKIYEYMSMGKPVAAPRLGPLEDGIEHGVVGMLFTPASQDAFAESVASLLENDERRTRMGRAARQHVLERHTWVRNAERVLDLLGRVRDGQAPAEKAGDRAARPLASG